MSDGNFLALDIGEKRIGVARANGVALIAEPLKTLDNDKNFTANLHELVGSEGAKTIVIGLPRNLHGEDTAQTEYVREFVSNLNVNPGLKVVFQDEATSSIKAEEYLKSQKKPYSKADIDAEAARVILQDFIDSVILTGASR